MLFLNNILVFHSNLVSNNSFFHLNDLLSSWVSKGHCNGIKVGLLNLMLGKLWEHLFKGTSRNWKVRNQVLLKSHGAKISEDLMKSNLGLVILSNFILRFHELIGLRLSLYFKSFELSCNSNCVFSQEVVSIGCDVLIDIFCSWIVLDEDTVASSICCFQMCWRTVGYKASIDHDCNIVTKRFCFIHSMCSQNERRISETFKHCEQASSRYWINTSRWLI